MNGWHFAEPSWAWLLVLTPLFYIAYRALLHHRRRVLELLGAPRWRAESVHQQPDWMFWLRVALISLAWVCLVISLMQPRSHPRPKPSQEAEPAIGRLLERKDGEGAKLRVRRKSHTVIVLIDASASMQVQDTRLGVSRLDYAKDIVDELISGLDGQEIALYAFTSKLTTVVPRTYDYLYTRLLLRRVGINEGDVAGTDLLEALGEIKDKHLSEGSDRARTLLLFSDGGDTRLETLTGAERSQEETLILSQFGNAERSGLQVFTLGLGSPEGAEIPGLSFEGAPVRSTLDEALLRALAERGRGAYFATNQYSALSIAEAILSRIRAADRYEDAEKVLKGVTAEALQGDTEWIYTEYYLVLIIAAFVALALAQLLPLVRKDNQHLEIS